MRRAAPFALVTLLLAAPAAAGAQRVEDRALALRDVVAAQPARRGSLPLEMLAGTAGSLAGIALVGLNVDCGVEDLGCLIKAVAGGGARGAVGAAVGVTLAARGTGAPRSALGAGLGAVAGTGAGLGVHYLLNRGTDRNLGDAVVIPIFAVSQGVGAALGSRWLGR